MKKFLRGSIALLLTAILAFAAVACNKTDGPANTGDSSGAGNKGESVTVTFNYNYEGAPSARTETVEYDDIVDEPTSPKRVNYRFTGWFKDAAATQAFDFEEALTADVTVYAGWQLTHVVLSFDSNGGSVVESVTLEVGGTATQPTNPTKEGNLFSGWFTDSAATTAFDFATPINADTTVYAGWTEDKGNNVTVTYMYNYEGAPSSGVYYTDTADKGTLGVRFRTPAAPTREGEYEFSAWYTDAECTTAFDFNTRVTASTTLYAKWNNVYTFEAEYTKLVGKSGVGFSSGASGVEMAVKDKSYGNAVKASNNWWVSYLYYNGAFIEFDIESDSAVTDAILSLRLSVEFYDIILSTSNFTIEVNGDAVNFSSINLDGALEGEDNKRPFETYENIATISLKEGKNTIKLIVNNEVAPGEIENGTIKAYAPMIDCIYVKTNASLTWEPQTSNIEGR